MRRRLYFMLPSVANARALLDELLLKRIEERHMHFMAKEGTLPPDMPDVNFFQRTDLVHGAQMGMMVGGGAGLLAGILLVLYPPEGITLQTFAILVATFGGAVFGGWASGMNAAAIPNTRLARFMDRIEQGQVLLIIDLPVWRVKEIETLIAERHPEIDYGGIEKATVPAFP